MRRIALCLFISLSTGDFLAFADDPPPTSKSETAFDTLFKDWKAMLARMRMLQEKFQVAGVGERPAIETEFNQLRQQGKTIAPKLVAAAVEAYKANPAKDSSIAHFLMANVDEDVRSENYEDASRLGKLLLENGYPEKSLYAYLGMAEYATGDFENAKKHLTKASELGTIKDVKPAAEALAAVDTKLAQWPEEEKIRAAEAKADDLPRVKFVTSKGDIVLELFENEAPNTVANFISLVEKGFYDGLVFHRVIPAFMAQGGDPLGSGSGGPGYSIECECTKENYRKHFRGSISMAHAGPNTGGSQFFLTFVPTAHLDGKHTVFGRVIEGMDVLAKLQRTEDTKQLGPPDKIIKAEVLRKRSHEYQPVKNAEK